MLPKMEVHPETYEVRADGELLTCEPATELPMAQRYFVPMVAHIKLPKQAHGRAHLSFA
jgi:hypothetical protein